MWVVNFGHPLTEGQREAIARLTGETIEQVLDVPCQFDHGRSFGEQAGELVDAVSLSPTEWQSLPLVVCPPNLAIIACTVLAELHGRMGYFPSVIRLRPVLESFPPHYEVAEVINLQALRERARTKRQRA